MKKLLAALVLALGSLPAQASAAATGCGFPNSLDSFSDVVSGQTLTAALFNKLQCGVEKLETAVNGTANTIILSSGALTLAAPFIDGSQFYAPDSGSTDAYVATRNKAAVAYVTGMWVFLRPNTVNTGVATLNLDSLGVKTIKQSDGSALTDGLLAAGICCYHLIYDGTDFKLVGAIGGSGGGSGTVSGTTGKLARFTSSTAVGDSGCVEDGAGNISCGDVSGNYHTVTSVSPTAVRTHYWPDASGHMTYNKSITFLIGDRVTGSALTDAHDYPLMWSNDIAAMTITQVKCTSDAGTPIINLQRDDGSPANVLSSNLTCSTSGATGTIDTAEDNLAVGNNIGFTTVTAGGAAKEVTISIKATLD